MMDIERMKECIEDNLNSLKKYCKENKRDLVQKTLLTVSGVTIGIMGYKNNEMMSVLKEALKANDSLANRVTELEDTNVQLLTLYRQGISDGLRNGSPVCGQHMRNLQKITMNQDF